MSAPDPRITAIEDNIAALYASAGPSSGLVREPYDDVLALHSDVAFPLFNPLVAPRFAAGQEERRVAEMQERYLERGLPFMWNLLPSTTTAGLVDALEETGLHRSDSPGMHAELSRVRDAELPGGATISLIEPTGVTDWTQVMVAGFAMPDDLVEPGSRLIGSLPTDTTLLALVQIDGRPVACGTAFLTGEVCGLYNIATLEDVRGRGIGAATTAWLMEQGRRRGCTEAILQASEMGFSVYASLGFETVCTLTQYIWAPPGA